MTASVANGFGHILYTPDSTTCQEAPYAFHPEYSTANPRGNTWSAHTYNVAMSDEIGHFENCLRARRGRLNCTKPGSQDAGGLDEDDGNNFCVPGTDSTLVKINGCFSADEDWDGQSYRTTGRARTPNPFVDQALHPSPVLFTSPLANGTTQLLDDRVRDRPAADRGRRTPRTTRRSATERPARTASNPPDGAQFYPFFTTGIHDGTCTWQEGGNFIPGHDQPLRRQLDDRVRPAAADGLPGARLHDHDARFDNFNSGDQANPCPVGFFFR